MLLPSSRPVERDVEIIGWRARVRDCPSPYLRKQTASKRLRLTLPSCFRRRSPSLCAVAVAATHGSLPAPMDRDRRRSHARKQWRCRSSCGELMLGLQVRSVCDMSDKAEKPSRQRDRDPPALMPAIVMDRPARKKLKARKTDPDVVKKGKKSVRKKRRAGPTSAS